MKKGKENYRRKYKRYYGIDFSSEYDIHHIDFDRTNNDISNLLLLPKELHARYHRLINDLGGKDKNGFIKINILINLLVSNYALPIMEQLCATIQEVEEWVSFKHRLDQQIQIKNIRGYDNGGNESTQN